MKKFTTGATGAALCALLFASPATNAIAGERSDYVGQAQAIPDDSTDQLIIKLRDNSSADLPARVQAVGKAMGISLAHVRAMSGNAHVVRMAKRLRRADAHALAWKLAGNASVLSIEPDGRMVAQQLPNDPMFAQQWHYYEAAGGINLPAAWDISTGSAAITIAVIDSGVRPHAELAGRLLPGYDFISDVTMANDGSGRDTDATDPGDYGCNNSNSSWHGTHVAGTLGAASNNSSGVSGVNWVSKLLPVRTIGRCGGYTSDIIDGLRWAAGMDIPNVPKNTTPARVANLSIGGANNGCSAYFQSAIDDVTARGTVVVVAAGNNNADVAAYDPANCNNVIAVAATSRNGGRAGYSNYGGKIAIAAPGGDGSGGILSTLNAGLTTPGADSYANFQGTSMAAPHVSGTVSLMLSVNPALTPAQVRQMVQSSARAFPRGTGNDCSTSICGAGIVDAGGAVAAARAALVPVVAPAPAPVQVPAPAPTPTLAWTDCAGEGGTCTFSGTRQVRYGANGSYAYKSATGSIACSNGVFGDPIYGTVKTCQYAGDAGGTPAPAVTWTACAGEGGSCTFSGTRQVRYGANGSYAFRSATGVIACSNDVFGDPIYGTLKVCDYSSVVN
ncbi:MAG: subtilase family protein [Burkholderia sp.]|nr:subtilase family protein [Burkholderia sp.]